MDRWLPGAGSKGSMEHTAGAPGGIFASWGEWGVCATFPGLDCGGSNTTLCICQNSKELYKRSELEDKF